jgi:4-hydroxy-tetrahydrodipicolinate synthase
MTNFQHLAGVYAAAITPLLADFSPDPDGLVSLIEFLSGRGCHGVLLFGTTGEGPSFSPAERINVLRAVMKFRNRLPHFRIFLGTGTPSLQETIELTRAAFESGCDGVVVLPPYYYRKVSDDGLFAWFSQVLQAVPQGSACFGYHIPPITGVGFSFDLLARLKETYPDRFAGIKDSSADLDHALRIGEEFGNDLLILNGTDRLFSQALLAGASGCITALGNVFSPELRQVWEAHKCGKQDQAAQARLNTARAVSESYPPAPPLLKMLVAGWYGFPYWPVRPPLLPMTDDNARAALDGFHPLRDA